jgi:hypothetical protein
LQKFLTGSISFRYNLESDIDSIGSVDEGMRRSIELDSRIFRREEEPFPVIGIELGVLPFSGMIDITNLSAYFVLFVPDCSYMIDWRATTGYV